MPQKAPVVVSAPKPAPAPAVPPPSAQSTAPQKPARITGTQAPTVAKTANVTFAFSKATAKQVSVCGEFNAWSPGATPMKRQADGHWETTLALSSGRYEYKLLVDGEWISDPAAQNSVANQYGSFNSVVEVRV
jgi:1,4-alpha-glucan branching enzyme